MKTAMLSSAPHWISRRSLLFGGLASLVGLVTSAGKVYAACQTAIAGSAQSAYSIGPFHVSNTAKVKVIVITTSGGTNCPNPPTLRKLTIRVDLIKPGTTYSATRVVDYNDVPGSGMQGVEVLIPLTPQKIQGTYTVKHSGTALFSDGSTPSYSTF